MRSVICLLLMTAFVGCHPTHTETPKPKVNKRPDVKAPKLDHKSFSGDLDIEAFAKPLPKIEVGSELLKGVHYKCVATGKFNLAENRRFLAMETMCVGDLPGGKDIVHVEDQKAPRANSHFNIPFEAQARVVIKRGKLKLHYKDEDGALQSLDLPRGNWGQYEYSFTELVPDALNPHMERRIM